MKYQMLSFVDYYATILKESLVQEINNEPFTSYDVKSEYMGYKEACRLLGSYYDSPRYENGQHVYEVSPTDAG